MRRRRKLFFLAGVVAVDLDQGRRDSLEVAVHQLEQATRDAVREVGQTAINARVAPADNAGEVCVDIGFSGDRAGAIAAVERWRSTVTDLAGVRGVPRTWLGGADGLNLEWCDDDYQKELEARSRSADAETTRQTSAQVPDERPRPTGRAWLADWDEAARNPWKTRLFLAAAFAVLGVISAALAGDLTPWSLAVGAALGAVAGDRRVCVALAAWTGTSDGRGLSATPTRDPADPAGRSQDRSVTISAARTHSPMPPNAITRSRPAPPSPTGSMGWVSLRLVSSEACREALSLIAIPPLRDSWPRGHPSAAEQGRVGVPQSLRERCRAEWGVDR
jgi:hypothetical protein